MVHRDDRRLAGVRPERRIEAPQLLGLEGARVLAGDRRIDHDQLERTEVDRVVDRSVRLAGESEGLTHRATIVVIAGQDVDRHLEAGEQLAGAPVLGGSAMVGDVTGDDDRVDRGRQPAERRDHEGGAEGRVDSLLLRIGPEVEVAELGEDERTSQDGDSSAGPTRPLGPASPRWDDVAVIKPFADIDWVEAHRSEVVLADCRWYLDGRSGQDAYEAGHIAGAVFVDLEAALTRHADPTAAGRHPLAEPDAFAAAMGALGIGDDDTVIAYDDAGGVIAARLVWMLRAIGHEAALLDGGLQGWDDELQTGSASRPPDSFTSRGWPAERLATIDDAAGAPQLIDARPLERFLGGPDEVDPRAGHIPGARSVPCRENLDQAGRLLPAEELRARFGVDDATEVITYCGSGVTACHNLLAMEQAGLGAGRLFPGSWSQWSRDPARPAEPGAVGTP
jgi:thiosulfate/3-mercaptopyruvate sulfurtransferase